MLLKCWDSPDMEARLDTNAINYFVKTQGSGLGWQHGSHHTTVLSSISILVWGWAPGQFNENFWIDFLSVCGYKEAPGNKLLEVNLSSPGKTVNPASPITTSKFLIIMNHLLTQNGNDHTPGHSLESDRPAWDLSFGFLPKRVGCTNTVRLFTSLSFSFLISKIGMKIFTTWELLRRESWCCIRKAHCRAWNREDRKPVF